MAIVTTVAIRSNAIRRACGVSESFLGRLCPATSPWRASSWTTFARALSLAPAGMARAQDESLPGSHQACCEETEHSSASKTRPAVTDFELEVNKAEG